MAKKTTQVPGGDQLNTAFPSIVLARGEFEEINREPFAEFHCGSDYGDFGDGDIIGVYKLECIKRIKRTVTTKAVDL